ncbi:class I SAM-dependent methyltransferase [Hyphobacterium sp.]|uniref:class I SAM-dependent methyltransferase n=1 Tax=Hyphobacterium sp. TaxID=2004662 RepID=UPI003B520C16
MKANDSQFTGSIPDYYDRCLGPNIFVDFAGELAVRAASCQPTRLLELAAGTGIASLALRSALPNAELTITDLNAPMLKIAAAKFDVASGLTFQPADASKLPFDDAAFDLIACQFGVMFFPDKVAAFREARRVLEPGGQYVFNVWDSMANNPFSRIASELVVRMFPDNPPSFYNVPFGYFDTDRIAGDMKQAGFARVDFEIRRLDKKVADWDMFASGLVFGNPLIEEIRAHGGIDPEEVVGNLTRNFRAAFADRDNTMPLQSILCVAS